MGGRAGGALRFRRSSRNGSLFVSNSTLCSKPRHVLTPKGFFFRALLFLAIKAALIFLEIRKRRRPKFVEHLGKGRQIHPEVFGHVVNAIFQPFPRGFVRTERFFDVKGLGTLGLAHYFECAESVAAGRE